MMKLLRGNMKRNYLFDSGFVDWCLNTILTELELAVVMEFRKTEDTKKRLDILSLFLWKVVRQTNKTIKQIIKSTIWGMKIII